MKLNEIYEIKDFLGFNLEDAKRYDFSNEGAPLDYCEENDAIDKFFIYRSGGKSHGFYKKEKYDFFEKARKMRIELLKKYNFKQNKDKENEFSPLIIDPDSQSKLLQKIYKILWDIKEDCPEYMKSCLDKGNIQGETLNSVNTTLNYYYENYIEQEEKEKIREKINKRQSVSKKYILSRYLNDSKTLKERISNKSINDFLNIYHTIGNFMPVPNNCNGPRGTHSINDYLDLNLLYIYHYYSDDNDKLIELIVGTEKAKDYKNWLDLFEGKTGKDKWICFVKKNYLQAFCKSEEEDYYPKELWKDHFSKATNVLPENKENCLEYFEKAYNMILARGEQMVEELNSRMENNKNESK